MKIETKMHQICGS